MQCVIARRGPVCIRAGSHFLIVGDAGLARAIGVHHIDCLIAITIRGECDLGSVRGMPQTRGVSVGCGL